MGDVRLTERWWHLCGWCLIWKLHTYTLMQYADIHQILSDFQLSICLPISKSQFSFLIPSISVRSLIFALVKTEPRVDFHLIAFQLNRNILSLGCANVICIIIIVGDQFVYRNNGCRCQKSDSLNLKYWYDILLYTAKQYQHRYYSQRLFYSK